MKKFTVLTAILIVVSIIVSCTSQNKEQTNLTPLVPVLPATPYDYSPNDKPSHVPGNFKSVEDNKATLGRVLFYDKMLSVNNSIACASCHSQQLAFADGKKVSGGFTAAKTHRNSMAIMNPGRSSNFFWDERESELQTMVLKPIQNHVEMGFSNMDNVVKNIQNTNYYGSLFTKAFGNDEITPEKIAIALEQFLTSMESYHSKYDVGKQNQFANFTEQERIGKKLFLETLHCGGCHGEPDFTQNWRGGANIGLDLDYTDNGKGDLPFAPPTFPNNGGDSQKGVFKIPSLRNIALTGPYMHDGRFNTLEEVVEHYNSGVKDHPNLDWRFTNTFDREKNTFETHSPNLNLTQNDKAALVAFMKTLTDYQYITDNRFANPFKPAN